MTRSTRQLALLRRIRDLSEKGCRDSLVDAVRRQHDAESELQEIDGAIDGINSAQRKLTVTGQALDIDRYERMVVYGEQLNEERRAQILRVQELERMQQQRSDEYVAAWKDRRAAEKRHDRERREDERVNVNRQHQEQLDNWIAREEQD